jgi:type III restriction enzyme
MELKEYQKQVLRHLSNYLTKLNTFRETYDKAMVTTPELARDYHFPEKAWEGIGKSSYNRFQNGLGEPLPNIFFKIPTGGGKTILACHAIDQINKLYLKKQTGMVLWIVPTSQIYNQTLEALRNRNHPYRQLIDISSGGKTLILEKLEVFNPQDVEENLCIMLLMLPSANRKTKESLKVFKDNGNYVNFFPVEDDYEGQAKLLEKFPNLHSFGEKDDFFGILPKTSMGNTLKLLKPIVIIDEGHKAYSQGARETIYDFNPSFVLELSATPPTGVNELVQVTGKQLNDEEMIKLDIHLTNKTTSDWKSTISEAKAFRDNLEQKAKEYEQNTSKYIRPIMLVQVERTGNNQRDGIKIHSEDVKDYLIKQCAIPPEQIAIKTSSKDEIENIDLLSKECLIRYIVTKQALQEGWDCPFAYILTSLANSQSETAMTQLIGRVLRQPYAVKTGVKELDECYVYTHQYNTTQLVRGIKNNLESEGLGDIADRMSISGNSHEVEIIPKKTIKYRDDFQKFAGKIFLPIFAVQDGDSWREVSYRSDILSQINWTQADLSYFDTLSLEKKDHDDVLVEIGFRDSASLTAGEEERLNVKSKIDFDYVARQLIDVIPNPWICYDIGKLAVDKLLARFNREIVAFNLVFAIEELKKILFVERDKLSEQIFRDKLKKKEMKFFLLKSDKSRNNPSLLPKSMRVRSEKALFNFNVGQPLERSLFSYIPAENTNELETKISLFLDDQKQLLWWYRNMSKSQYRIQGWRPDRIYPDFVASRKAEDIYDKVYVLESKGEHLEFSDDSSYKRAVLDLCNELAIETDAKKFDIVFDDPEFEFKMIDQREWKNQLNEILR